MEEFSEEELKKELENGYEKAEEILKDNDKMERFLQRLEAKLKLVPVAGNVLSMIPTLVSLIKSYVNKEYLDVPVGTIIAVISALLYWVSPVDIIPDVIPVFGYVDDAAVIGFCIKMINSDINEYQKWREENNKIIEEQGRKN